MFNNVHHWLALFFFVTASHAGVTRHDVAPELYSVKEAPGFFVNMPHEGSGALISPYWVLSAGHVIYYDGYEGKKIVVGGKENVIEKVIFHPNYKNMPIKPFVGDAAPLMAFLHGRVDLVLIKLSDPVTHVQPISRYYKSDEMGKMTTTYGSGATGTGITGEQIPTKVYRSITKFNNHVEEVEPHFLKMRFDFPETALPLEGTIGSGDSGGPTLIEDDGKPYLVGISSFRDFEGDLKDFKGGIYGSVAVMCRVSAFNDWIDKTIEAYSN